MEDRRDHRVSVVVLVLALLILPAASAAAQSHEDDQFDFESTTVVDTNADAVVVNADAGATVAGTAGSGGGSGCWLNPVTNIGQAFYDSFKQQLSGGLTPFFLWCKKDMRGLVWLDTSEDDPATALDPETIAMHLRDEIPVPNAEIGINPGRGLVGVESWFWLEGYDGSPIEDSTDAFGQLVEVEARVKRYEWSFGDGNTIAARTPGRSYPHRSQIRHVYERSSAGLPSGFPIEVTFAFNVRYRVDGGGWIEIPGISRVAETSYRVRESQAVIQQ
jgi:hypothetical protein